VNSPAEEVDRELATACGHTGFAKGAEMREQARASLGKELGMGDESRCRDRGPGKDDEAGPTATDEHRMDRDHFLW
jgi:hypothetical protein